MDIHLEIVVEAPCPGEGIQAAHKVMYFPGGSAKVDLGVLPEKLGRGGCERIVLFHRFHTACCDLIHGLVHVHRPFYLEATIQNHLDILDASWVPRRYNHTA